MREEAEMRVVMLSLPGAGKGTQCRYLAKATGVAHISSGDLLRAEMATGSAIGRIAAAYAARGDLVPDDVLFDLLVPVVLDADRVTGGYLLDGFPRTMAQALRAAEIGVSHQVGSDAVVYLSVPEAVLVDRLLTRAGREGRADDTPDVIKHRIAVFERQTRPLVDYYRRRGLLLEVDADRPEDVVQADLRSRLPLEAR
jgi:adenylate kinase